MKIYRVDGLTRREWLAYVDKELAPLIRKEAPTQDCSKLASPETGYEYPAFWGLHMFKLIKNGLYYPVAPDGIQGEGKVTLREAKILAEKMVWSYRRRITEEQSGKKQVTDWIETSCSDGTWF